VFDVHFGEAFIVGFIAAAVLSARFWPKIGEIIAVRLSGAPRSGPERPSRPPSQVENDRGDGG
jgi:hypothetical protein